MAGFWASLWILLKPVAREAAKDAASAIVQKKFGPKTTDGTGTNAKAHDS